MHPRCKNDDVVSLAKEKGQARVGAAAGEDGHGATENRAGPRMAKRADENPQRALPVQEPEGGEKEARDPPNSCARFTRAADEGGEGEGDPPPRSARPQRALGAWGDYQTQQYGTPPRGREQEPEGDPYPQQRAQTARGQEEAGDRLCVQTACRTRPNEGGEPP